MAYTGVISIDSLCEWFWMDEVMNGTSIDLTMLEAIEDYCYANKCNEKDIPQEWFDNVEFESPTYIIGDWLRGDDGLYDVEPGINRRGYAAVVQALGGAYNVHVVWSETTANVRAMCSPCCPGQADLDSGPGDIEAYTLPSEFMTEE